MSALPPPAQSAAPRRAHVVHGFNVRDGGKATTDRLHPYLAGAGFEVVDEDYGWIGLLGVRLFNGPLARGIADRAILNSNAGVKPVGIGHSNGCAILARAADLGAPFEALVLINPALDAERVIAPQVRQVHVYHSRHDAAVRTARWLRWHEWGDMGARGYQGPADARYKCFDCSDYIEGHSAIFDKLEAWGPAIVANLLAALSAS